MWQWKTRRDVPLKPEWMMPMTPLIDPRRNHRHSVALAVLVMSSVAAGLPSLPVLSVEAATTCIKMPCGGSGGAAESTSGGADSFPAEAPDFSGTFRMAYAPIMCVKAPCPPGSYSIYASDRSQFTARVGRIVLRAADGGEAAIFEGRYIGGRGLSVEGDIWIDDRVAYVRVRHEIDED
jgi:hypothetical protein